MVHVQDSGQSSFSSSRSLVVTHHICLPCLLSFNALYMTMWNHDKGRDCRFWLVSVWLQSDFIDLSLSSNCSVLVVSDSIFHNTLSLSPSLSQASYTYASSRRSLLWESSITRKPDCVTQWNTGGDRMLFISCWATVSTKMNGGTVVRAKSQLYFSDIFVFNAIYISYEPSLCSLSFLHFLLKLRCSYWCAGLSTLCFICW